MIAQLDKDYIKLRPRKAFDRLISYALFEGRPLTTSGRWINPLVFSLFALEKKLPQLKKVEKPIFILGTGRSGTTLLGVLLSMHSKISFLNEPKAIWHSIFQKEDIVGNYTDEQAFYRLSSEMAGPEIKLNAHKIYGCYLKLMGTERVVDKYPELIFRVKFVKAIFPDAKFLFLVRDGYDTCVSINQWSQQNGKANNNMVEDWWGKNQRKWNLLVSEIAMKDEKLAPCYNDLSTITDHKNRAVVEWCLTMREGIKLLKDPLENIHLVRYEALTLEPEKTIASILNYLELPPDEKVIEYAKKTVKPVARKEAFEIHPHLDSYFKEMMAYFNYSV